MIGVEECLIKKEAFDIPSFKNQVVQNILCLPILISPYSLVFKCTEIPIFFFLRKHIKHALLDLITIAKSHKYQRLSFFFVTLQDYSVFIQLQV
jgi:hypothetical protein